MNLFQNSLESYVAFTGANELRKGVVELCQEGYCF